MRAVMSIFSQGPGGGDVHLGMVKKLVVVCELWDVGPLIWVCGYQVRESYSFSEYR